MNILQMLVIGYLIVLCASLLGGWLYGWLEMMDTIRRGRRAEKRRRNDDE